MIPKTNLWMILSKRMEQKSCISYMEISILQIFTKQGLIFNLLRTFVGVVY